MNTSEPSIRVTFPSTTYLSARETKLHRTAAKITCARASFDASFGSRTAVYGVHKPKTSQHFCCTKNNKRIFSPFILAPFFLCFYHHCIARKERFRPCIAMWFPIV
ncbi:hypothetical protein TNCV_3042181 [Trichonephila clavipes]|nr:hypothetical protein TNCV_3042181 [Trichonephila clavipes]